MDKSACLETGGTTLQLAGSLITLGGLVWAWHTATRLLSQWGTAIGGLLTRIGGAVHEIIIIPYPTKITLQGGQPIVSVTPQAPGPGDLAATARPVDPTERRLNDLQHANEALRDQLTALDSTLSTEIESAKTELAKAKMEHIEGLYFALGGSS